MTQSPPPTSFRPLCPPHAAMPLRTCASHIICSTVVHGAPWGTPKPYSQFPVVQADTAAGPEAGGARGEASTGTVRRPLQYSRPATSPTTQSMPFSSPSPEMAEHGTIRHLCDSICSSPSACRQLHLTTEAHISNLVDAQRTSQVLLVREDEQCRSSESLPSALLPTVSQVRS